MTDSPDPILVFDLGGTRLRSALYSPASSSLVARRDCPAPSFHRFENARGEALIRALGHSLSEEASTLLQGREPGAIGLGFPGPVNRDGEAASAPTLWGEHVQGPIDILRLCQEIWPAFPVVVVNDVTAAGYRYARANGVDCVVTVSSGVGHKIFVDGVPIVGPKGRGGEIGHWRIDHSSSAPLCECGGRGHIGAVASGRAVAYQLQRVAKANPEWLHQSSLRTWMSDAVSNADQNIALAKAFHADDLLAQRVVEALAQPLGEALAALHLSVGVQRFVLVGGFAMALGEPYLGAVARGASSASSVPESEWVRWLELGSSDDDSGLLGLGGHLAACTVQGV